jgi:DtxR family Mn-dependent transcriptional regulator
MQTRAASVTDMIKRLASKDLVKYRKYHGVSITENGRVIALKIIRKHRLWETFLVEKLHFNWDEVHEVAEQLEHIQSALLITRLDEYLGHPSVDPHGDPIPTADGKIEEINRISLVEFEDGLAGRVIAVKDSSPEFLRYLDKTGISIGSEVKILDRVAYDNSLEIELNKSTSQFISNIVAENLWVQKAG